MLLLLLLRDFGLHLAKEFRYSPQFLQFRKSSYWWEYQHCPNLRGLCPTIATTGQRFIQL